MKWGGKEWKNTGREKHTGGSERHHVTHEGVIAKQNRKHKKNKKRNHDSFYVSEGVGAHVCLRVCANTYNVYFINNFLKILIKFVIHLELKQNENKCDLCVCPVVLHARIGTDVIDTNAFIESAYGSIPLFTADWFELSWLKWIRSKNICITFTHSHSHFSSSK